MAVLQATNLTRSFGDRCVLNDLSFTLEAGEFTALMGPSGSGKSTFLHVAAGLLGVDRGAVLIGETEVTKLSDSAAAKFRRRHIGVVFQEFNLLDEKTVAENIAFPCRLDHVKPDAAFERALVERMGIASLLKRKPETLSGGERQRVAFARALIRHPDVVLADEPTGNLDAQASREICRLLTELHQTSTSAILLVTHDPVVAAAADRVAFLKEGRIARTELTNHDPAHVSQLYLETYQ